MILLCSPNSAHYHFVWLTLSFGWPEFCIAPPGQKTCIEQNNLVQKNHLLFFRIWINLGFFSPYKTICNPHSHALFV